MPTLYAARLVLPVAAPPIRDAGVLVADGRVLAVGPAAELSWRAGRVRRLGGLVLPGLVNAHAHLEYGPAFADLAEGGRPFWRWIATLTARRRELDSAGWAEQARASAAAALASGTTAVADVVTHGAAIAARRGAGLAGVSYAEAVGVDAAGWAGHERARVLGLLDAGADGLSPHTLYTLGTGVYAEVLALARQRGLRLHPHLAETAEETAYVSSGTGPLATAMRRLGLAMELLDVGCGRSPAAELDARGGLGPDVHVAHGVHLDAADRALLRARRSPVALCVRSNATLGAGAPPVAAYLREGSPLAVGTDSLASTPDLDLLAELRALRTLAVTQGYRDADLDRRLVAAATRGGAAALGHDDLGVLRPGARADLAAFDLDGGGGADPYAALLAGGRWRATVLAGEVVAERAAGTERAAGAERAQR